MIESKNDYFEYIEADKKANHVGNSLRSQISITWKYLKCLRKLEYVVNCQSGLLARIKCNLLKYKLYNLSVKSGITIPVNTFGKGLYLPHHGAIIVNHTARFGDNCVVQSGVNISNDVEGGNHIYLGAGAKVMIGVKIGNDVIIGANAVLTKNVDESNVVVAGTPARIISHNGFHDRDVV